MILNIFSCIYLWSFSLMKWPWHWLLMHLGQFSFRLFHSVHLLFPYGVFFFFPSFPFFVPSFFPFFFFLNWFFYPYIILDMRSRGLVRFSFSNFVKNILWVMYIWGILKTKLEQIQSHSLMRPLTALQELPQGWEQLEWCRWLCERDEWDQTQVDRLDLSTEGKVEDMGRGR